MTAHALQLLQNNNCKACLLGWVDFEKEQDDALICLIEKSIETGLPELTNQNYKKLYFNN